MENEQCAIEFAEYMAKNADDFLRAFDELQIAQIISERGVNYAVYDSVVEAANSKVDELWHVLNCSIYEFRERAKRCYKNDQMG